MARAGNLHFAEGEVSNQGDVSSDSGRAGPNRLDPSVVFTHGGVLGSLGAGSSSAIPPDGTESFESFGLVGLRDSIVVEGQLSQRERIQD